MKKRLQKGITFLMAAVLGAGLISGSALAAGPAVFYSGDIAEADEIQAPDGTSDETAETETETEPETEPETEAPEEEGPKRVVVIDDAHIVPDGVHVNGTDLSGLTVAEAKTKISEMAQAIINDSLIIRVGENEVAIPNSSYGLAVDENAVIENICGIGEFGDVLTRYMELADISNAPVDFKLPFTFDQGQLEQVIAYETAQFDTAPVNASIVRSDGEFQITEDVNGLTVDGAATAALVAEAVADDWDGSAITVEAVAMETEAEHTSEELALIQDEIGSYSTDFSGSSSNRCSNIANGASLINGTVLYPGEEFSFLDHVTPFTFANGYSEATGYSGGKVVPSVGGGICQVSTTLYNAVLRAELEVTERSCHGLTVSYVPLGADATVSEGSCDFRFKNNLDTPIYIQAYTSGSNIYISIYGQEYRASNRTLNFYSVTEQTLQPGEDVYVEDPTMPVGYSSVTQSAHTGYVASFYKEIYIDGALQSTELVNSSTYRSSPRYITIGTLGAETDSSDDSADTGSSDSSSVDSGASDSLSDEEAADAAASEYE